MRLTWRSAKLDHSICCEIGEYTPLEMVYHWNDMETWNKFHVEIEISSRMPTEKRNNHKMQKNFETLIVKNNKKSNFSWICLVYQRKQRKAKFIWIFLRFLIWNHSEFCNLHAAASEMNLGTCVDFLKFVLNYTAAFEKLGPLWCTSVLVFT